MELINVYFCFDMSTTNKSNESAPTIQESRNLVDLSGLQETGMDGIAGSSSGSAAQVLTAEMRRDIDALVEAVKSSSRAVFFTGYWASEVLEKGAIFDFSTVADLDKMDGVVVFMQLLVC